MDIVCLFPFLPFPPPHFLKHIVVTYFPLFLNTVVSHGSHITFVEAFQSGILELGFDETTTDMQSGLKCVFLPQSLFFLWLESSTGYEN